MQKRIILASSSKQRKMIMDCLGLDFEVIPADIDEKSIRDSNLELRAKKIAQAKAETVAQGVQAIIIAADTFSVFEGKVFEKPASKEEAIQMLQSISGKKILSLTGFHFVDQFENRVVSEIAKTQLTIRKLSQEEIEPYVQTSPVLTWAAAYSLAFPYGASLVQEISGSLTGCSHGLPTELLIPQLELSGIKISPK